LLLTNFFIFLFSMEQSIQIPPEIFTTFNNVKFYNEPHKYYVNGKELISVTTLIHQYQRDFEEDYWSDIKAKEFSLEQYEIIRAWRFINKKGTMKGSFIHDYLENLFLNKKYEYPEEKILNEFGFDPIKKEYDITKQHADKFYKEVNRALIPIRPEYVVFDRETLVAGMVDMLFYNKKSKQYEIWDWKTNKEFTDAEPERQLLHELFTLDDCDLEIYSLQLELYKQIIERNLPIKLGQSHIVWFSHNNDDYKVIKTKNRKYYVNLLLEKRKKEIMQQVV